MQKNKIINFHDILQFGPARYCTVEENHFQICSQNQLMFGIIFENFIISNTEIIANCYDEILSLYLTTVLSRFLSVWTCQECHLLPTIFKHTLFHLWAIESLIITWDSNIKKSPYRMTWSDIQYQRDYWHVCICSIVLRHRFILLLITSVSFSNASYMGENVVLKTIFCFIKMCLFKYISKEHANAKHTNARTWSNLMEIPCVFYGY